MREHSGAIVLDASVILKWVLDAETEPGHAAANLLLDRWQRGELELFVPPLWLFEVGNILCLKRPTDASTALAALWDLGLSEVSFRRELVQRTVTRAHGLQLLGTLGVVLKARHLGLIPSAAQLVRALLQAGLYLDEAILRKTLAGVGESWP
jgi:predicted nucleic acid-binding protein